MTLPAVTAILAEATARAEALKLTAKLLSESVRDVMMEIHGGDWRIQVEHEHAFVLIVQRSERRVSPKRGEAA